MRFVSGGLEFKSRTTQSYTCCKRFAFALTSFAGVDVLPWRYVVEMGSHYSLHATSGLWQREASRAVAPPWIFIHGTDIVDRSLIVLFFGLFSVGSLLEEA